MKRKAEKPLAEGYTGTIVAASGEPTIRVVVGVPMTGMIRSEWVLARYGQVIPCNWSSVDVVQWLDQYSPLRFSVADARNAIATRAIMENAEWLLFIDHDVILPPTTLLRMNEYMQKGDVPIVGGLYFTKSVPSEPLIYRGRGNSYFRDWILGDPVWVDGMGLGCHLIHTSILKEMAKTAEMYQLPGLTVHKIFETPARVFYDPERNSWTTSTGTEDLEWYGKIIAEDILTKAGWPKIAKKPFPFLCDTALYCRHIDWNGAQFPARGEEKQFLPKKEKKVKAEK